MSKSEKKRKGACERMANRARSIQQKFFITEEEEALIRQKMALLGTKNKSAYLRKMALDGFIIKVNYYDIKKQTAALQKIGGNVNQIIKRMNQTGNLYREDVDEIKELMNEIWRLQRYTLSKAR